MSINSDLEMIKDETTWPIWPYLPMKKRKPEGQFPDLGVIVSDKTKSSFKIYHASVDDIIMLGKNLDDISFTEYLSWEAAVADGWIID